MAKAFSAKQYFKKIYAPDLIVELYKRHNIVALFEITEQTPRKNAVGIFTDFYSSLSPEEKILVDEDLALVASVSTQYAPSLCINLLKKKGIPHEVTQIECTSDHDKTMYYYLFHKDIFDEMFFFHDFYTSKGYMRYEAKKVDLEAASFATTELTKEFTRIVNKDENQTECSVNHNVLENILYVTAQFSSGKEIVTEQDKETLTMRPVTKKKEEKIHIAYLPEDEEVLIKYTGGNYEKLIFLDTFLRIVCKSGYEAKEESYSLTSFSRDDFDIAKTNKGVPLMTWKVKGVSISFGQDKAKKKIKFTIPSSMHESGMTPLLTTLRDIGIEKAYKEASIDSVILGMTFVNKDKPEKSIPLNVTVSRSKSSLCSLFTYDRYARSLLKEAGIDNGFVEAVKKEKDNMEKKWEM